MSMLNKLCVWLRRKQVPPLTTAEFTISIASPSQGRVDLSPYTEKEIKHFCKTACPPNFEIVEYPTPGEEPLVLLHLRGEPASQKHKMFIVRIRSSGGRKRAA